MKRVLICCALVYFIIGCTNNTQRSVQGGQTLSIDC